MKKEARPVSKLTLEDVHEQFREWRKSKAWHDPIPEELWDAAVELSKEYSPTQVCKTLRLESSKFKERVHASRPKENDVSPSFVELNFGNLPASAEYILEAEDSGGRKMRICVKGQTVDVLGLAKAFWTGES